MTFEKYLRLVLMTKMTETGTYQTNFASIKKIETVSKYFSGISIRALRCDV